LERGKRREHAEEVKRAEQKTSKIVCTSNRQNRQS